MKKFKILTIILLGLSVNFISCDELFQDNVSEEEIVEGLKTALEMGTDTACAVLNIKNGYYGNELVRILLPNEADIMFSVLEDPTVQLLGLDVLLERKMDSVVLAINRAAEDVADDAKPIFKAAIINMAVSDGLNILQGHNIFSSSKDSTAFDSLAATHYMEYITREELFNLYEPKIDIALGKDLGLGFSANEAWETLLYFYNDYIVVLSNNYNAIEEVDLSEYSADKGLDGLFLFVGNQEKDIRKDPYIWASDILEKVFGSVYEE